MSDEAIEKLTEAVDAFSERVERFEKAVSRLVVCLERQLASSDNTQRRATERLLGVTEEIKRSVAEKTSRAR